VTTTTSGNNRCVTGGIQHPIHQSSKVIVVGIIPSYIGIIPSIHIDAVGRGSGGGCG
jgi:hypothetical protein